MVPADDELILVHRTRRRIIGTVASQPLMVKAPPAYNGVTWVQIPKSGESYLGGLTIW